MWLRVCSNDHASLTVMPYIFFFKIKNCLNDDLFISCDDRIGKMLHNICISAYLVVQLHRSFRNYAYLFYMVWRCARIFGVIQPLSFFNFVLFTCFFFFFFLCVFFFFFFFFSFLVVTRWQGNLWAQLFLQFYTKLFETCVMHVVLSWSENVHFGMFMCFWVCPPINFYDLFTLIRRFFRSD